MQEKFGLAVVKKSFRELGAAAKEIPDRQAQAAWQPWQSRLMIGAISTQALLSAVKIYLAVKGEIERDPAIQAVGINCLNESQFSDTTPCLAWAMLHEEIDLTWGCEADLVSMLTMYLLHHVIGQTKEGNTPFMMTNLYPFLMGQAALKHERIPDFPTVDKPENHILAAHCGYLGVLPRCYAAEWALRKKVLAIVGQNATAIDARLPVGEITLAKLALNFRQINAVEGHLEGYAQYPGSDCLNGAVIRVPDGRKLIDGLYSHHYVIISGHCRGEIDLLGKIFGLEMV
jgi:L-fucose isomerase-like protein